ncbi:hypothetical protein GCM10020331_066320 [Ectobacillus funiculus]
MPLHIGMVILVSTPILNPIVFASTYYAFRTTPYIAYYRLGLAFVAAVIIGLIVYCLYRNQNVLKDQTVVNPHIHLGFESRWKQILQHAADEFFSVQESFFTHRRADCQLFSNLSRSAASGAGCI